MAERTDPPSDSVLQAFDLGGKVEAVELLSRGHIHDTFVSTVKGGSASRKFVHQRINTHVFPDVPLLMSNTDTITKHVSERAEGEDTSFSVVRTLGGELAAESEGAFWRTFTFVPNTVSFDNCESGTMGFEAASHVGRFLGYLRDLDPAQIGDTIPFFHHTPRRYEAFDRALETDEQGRATMARAEIEFAQSMREFGGSLVSALEGGELSLRITHNDTKLNNILFSKNSRKAICIVDLDTCMAGTALYDFGDLVRTACPTAAEDCPLGMGVNVDYLREITKGFVTGCGSTLSTAELTLLPIAPAVITLTIGLRFLTDYLDGDRYFKVSHPEQNLERSRAQFALVRGLREVEQNIPRWIEECS